MFISLVLQKSATNDIMSLTYQYVTPLKRKFTDTKVVDSIYGRIINTTGQCVKLDSSTLRELFIAVSRCGHVEIC
jgi:hypothetical protein